MQQLFNRKDMKQLQHLGLSRSEIERQIDRFKTGTPYVALHKACKIGDGIKALTQNQVDQLDLYYMKNMNHRNLLKFVPASGAATRMFESLLYFHKKYRVFHRDLILYLAAKGDENAKIVAFFMDNL